MKTCIKYYPFPKTSSLTFHKNFWMKLSFMEDYSGNWSRVLEGKVILSGGLYPPVQLRKQQWYKFLSAWKK